MHAVALESECFPRTGGDGPARTATVHQRPMLPPHGRGWTREARQQEHRRAASPARAGMDRVAHGCVAARPRFPRTGGDGPSRAGSHRAIRMLPPHGRGWTCASLDSGWNAAASPARAGMDRSPPLCRAASCCFPRTGGDGPVKAEALNVGLQLPPHGRGWTVPSRGIVHLRGASPARAGMDR